MRQARHAVCTMAIAALAGVVSGAAQGRPGETRLDEPTARAIEALVQQARAEGLPADPLRNKAIEGASKGADGARIVEAVRRLHERMRRAAVALGPGTSAAELVAAAAVLDVSVPDASLVALRVVRPGRSIASGLVGLAFLVQRGVAVERAVGLVRELLIADVNDTDFTRFRRLVEQDIRAGASAAGAAEVRTRAWIRHGVAVRGVTPEALQ
jgi:hypothetical protein